jgi:hypothetical protein
MKRRNPNWGCPRIAQQQARAEDDVHVYSARRPSFGTSDGKPETFARGERVPDLIRLERCVTFESVVPLRIAATYTMTWDEFIASTTAVRQANADGG